MRTQLRIPRALWSDIRNALEKPHPFALERVAFGFGASAEDGLIVLTSFASVNDEDYIEDRHVAARIGPVAISKALQNALQLKAAAFHVHIHPHRGMPWFSRTDIAQLPPVMQPFRNFVSQQPHGLILLSFDDCVAVAWYPGEREPRAITNVTIVGYPMVLLRGER